MVHFQSIIELVPVNYCSGVCLELSRQLLVLFLHLFKVCQYPLQVGPDLLGTLCLNLVMSQ